MRAVIQRVRKASVAVDGQCKGAIGPGLLVFLGVQEGDGEAELEWLCGKIPQIRCFEDAEGRMNLSLLETGGGLLLISQFTLFGSLKKGSRPSFNRAASPDLARRLYEQAATRLSEILGHPVATGVFAAFMEIESLLDGPVTLIVDTRDRGW